MLRALGVLVVLGSLAGCATKEGIALPTSKPTPDDIKDFNHRNSATVRDATQTGVPAKEGVRTTLVPPVPGAGLVVVGNAMALTVFDEATLNQRYDNYLAKLGNKPPTFTREWYVSTSAGESSVKFSGVTGLYSRFYRAEIPRDLVRQISFASAFGTFMVGSSADLVVAQVLPGYGSWVTGVLCSEKDANFQACESQHRQGVYQSADGREVDSNLKLVEGGAVIDLSTFRHGATPRGATAPQASSQPTGSASPTMLAPPIPVPVPSAAVVPAPSAAPVSAPPKDAAKQLQTLKELFDNGLISKEEYDRKRKEILDRL